MTLERFLKTLPDLAAREAFARRCGYSYSHVRETVAGRRPTTPVFEDAVRKASNGVVEFPPSTTSPSSPTPETSPNGSRAQAPPDRAR